jgi:ADP-ribose pyrophosphatase YjhB (NUDIX family)
MIWINPVTVSVLLVPVNHEDRQGLLVIRRGIEPQVGKLALVGGFLEAHEPWEVGGAREVREETRVVVDESTVEPFWFTSTEPRPNRVLLFGTVAPVESSAFAPHDENNAECTERGAIFGPGGLEDEFAFPLHVEAARRYFASLGVDADHGYVTL